VKVLVPTLLVCLLASLVACGDAGPAGTYVLVKDQALKDAMGGAGKEGLPKESLDLMNRMLDEMAMTLTLKPDGTFDVEGKMGAKFTASGTWKREGKNLTITSSVENGKAREQPETTALVYEDGEIRMTKAAAASPVDLVLRRK
jgi:hypothetical protein